LKFDSKWNMFKDEYVTVGSSDLAPSNFWAITRLNYRECFWLKLYNDMFKGVVSETDCVSYTIDIPYTSHRAFLKLFLLIDYESNTKINAMSATSIDSDTNIFTIFEMDLVQV